MTIVKICGITTLEDARQAVEAGRTAYEVGLGEVRDTASPTSPLTAFLN